MKHDNLEKKGENVDLYTKLTRCKHFDVLFYILFMLVLRIFYTFTVCTILHLIFQTKQMVIILILNG